MENIKIICNQLYPDPCLTRVSVEHGGRGELYDSSNGNAVMLCQTESTGDPLMDGECGVSELNSRPYLVADHKYIPSNIIEQVILCKSDFIEKKNVSYHLEGGFVDKEIIIIIPLKGRTDNIRTVLQSFTKDSSIGVIVVEGDTSSTSIKDISIEEGCSYIHIDVDEFNKSQCMNVAYSLIHSKTKADWFVFHDADVVLCSEFKDQIKDRIKRDDLPKFFQCFANKCVRYFEKNQSKTLRELISKEGPISEKNYNSFVESVREIGIINSKPSPGAPGGSICIHRDIFESIGGYDPEWCLRYGPEDSMFLIKANYFYDDVCYGKKHGTCGVHRIETENLDCLGCHLWHPTATFGDVSLFATSNLIQDVLINLDERAISFVLKSASLQLDRMKNIYKDTVEAT